MMNGLVAGQNLNGLCFLFEKISTGLESLPGDCIWRTGEDEQNAVRRGNLTR
jgi:hypothetical protein